MSITDSIRNFHLENGRTYHAYKKGCKWLLEATTLLSGPLLLARARTGLVEKT